uniref:Uncharacterized protein n=1 Tax=Noctiluca scintillans TaxID=2966 RepID=A0A7S1FBC2_NOCSC
MRADWFGTCCCAEKEGTLQEVGTALDEEPPAEKVDPPNVILAFEKPDGTSKQVTCTQRPLGMKYTKAVPLTVTGVHVHGHAHDLGIETGWKLMRIGETDLAGESSEVVVGILSEKTNSLPCV